MSLRWWLVGLASVGSGLVFVGSGTCRTKINNIIENGAVARYQPISADGGLVSLLWWFLAWLPLDLSLALHDISLETEREEYGCIYFR